MDFKNFFIAPTNRDVLLSFGAFFLISSILGFFSFLKIKFNLKEVFLKKILQGSVGLFAAFAPLVYSSKLPLIVASLFFFIIGIILSKREWAKLIFNERNTYKKISLFSLSYLILVLLFSNFEPKIILLSIALFAVSDSLPVIVIEKWTSKNNNNQTNQRLYLLYYFISSIMLFYLFYYFKFFNSSPWILQVFLLIVFSFSVSLLGKGKCFWFPFASAIFYFILLRSTEEQLFQILVGMGFAFLIVVLSYRAKFLSFSGSIMTFILATIVFGLGGWKYTVPILTFFILSSLLSKIGKNVKEKFKNTFEKSGVRDYAQVLANGGIPGILVVLNYIWPNPNFYYLYLLSLAISTADTWSTEIGVLSKTKPRLITTFKPVEPGISGALSIYGLIGGLLGSFLIFISGIFFTEMHWSFFIVMWALAFVGDLIDSFMGATIQGQYRCVVCQKYTEKKMHCTKPTKIIQGFKFIDNDFVNLSSNLIILMVFAILFFV